MTELGEGVENNTVDGGEKASKDVPAEVVKETEKYTEPKAVDGVPLKTETVADNTLTPPVDEEGDKASKEIPPEVTSEIEKYAGNTTEKHPSKPEPVVKTKLVQPTPVVGGAAAAAEYKPQPAVKTNAISGNPTAGPLKRGV